MPTYIRISCAVLVKQAKCRMANDRTKRAIRRTKPAPGHPALSSALPRLMPLWVEWSSLHLLWPRLPQDAVGTDDEQDRNSAKATKSR